MSLTMKKRFSATPANPWQLLEQFYPWLLLLAILALVWWIAQAFWLMVAPPKAPSLTPVPMQPNVSAQAMTGNALDIFTQPQAMQPQAAPPPDIKVLGVTIASPASASYAIINTNGKTQSYRVNDMLDGSNYTLAAVARDYIVIADASGQTSKVNFGQLFKLDQSDELRAKAAAAANPQAAMSLPSPDMPAPNSSSSFGMNSALNNGGMAMPNANGAVPPSANNGAMSNPDAGGKATGNSAQTAIGNAANNLQQNPASYLSQMGVSATGQGYLVTDGMPSALKNRLGLQTGDKVLSVNGQSVGQNPSQDAQLLQQVQRQGQAQIQVQRGEQVVTVRQSF
jgi:general secretion pathway protein C